MALSRILVPLDGSAFAETAYQHALAIAQATGAKIFLLRVLDTHQPLDQAPDTLEWRLHRAEAQRYLNHKLETGQRETKNTLEIESVLAEGKPAERIAQFIQDQAIDLLVLSTYGISGRSDFPFGGTAHKILTTVNVSYLIVRKVETTAQPPGYQRLLVPLDGSRKAELAIHFARKLDQKHDADIVLLHVFGIPAMTRKRPLTEQEHALRKQLIECNERSAQAYMEEVSQRLAPHHQIRIQLEAAVNPAQRIAEVAQQEQADLMILTAYGGAELNGWSRESICQSLLAATDIPVLTLQDSLRLNDNGNGSNAIGHNANTADD
ncbi:MAG: universal stress protein [Pseudomonadota bacterium]